MSPGAECVCIPFGIWNTQKVCIGLFALLSIKMWSLPMVVTLLAVWIVTAVKAFDDTFDTYTYIPMDPVFLPLPTNMTVREGGRAVLPCSIQHLGTKKVAWRRVGEDDDFLTIGEMTWTADKEEFYVKQELLKNDVSNWNLVINKVKPVHAGMYECQITSNVGFFRHVQLNVVGPPLTDPAISLSGSDFVERGEKILLVCNATGGSHIAEDIDWFKDGNIIDTSRPRHRDVIILKYRSLEEGALISKLQIDHADMDDAGTYVCRSSFNKLADFNVNVLAADSTNVKRGTQSSGSSGSWQKFQPRILLIGCWLVLYATWSSPVL